MCLVFRKLYVFGAAVEHSEEKKCKVDEVMCFFKNLTVTFLFVSPVEIAIVFPPAKDAIHNAMSLNAFGRK